MTFKLHYIDNQTNEKRYFLYDQHTSSFTDEDGSELFPLDLRKEGSFPEVPFVDYLNYPEAYAISPETPGKKHNRPKRIKIQLGLGCNYSCSYCLQATQIGEATKTSTADANIFLKQLDKWLDPTDLEKIEFWGGEPLLYWHKIKVLAPKLREKFPNVSFGIVTNGSLLTKEIIDDLKEWGFSISISHDGPGQHIRGPDPFDEPDMNLLEMIRYIDSKKISWSFLSVLSSVSYDPSAIIEWFHNRLNKDVLDRINALPEKQQAVVWSTYPVPQILNPRCNFEGIVHDYNGDETSSFTKEQLDDMGQKLIIAIQKHGSYTWTFSRKIREIVESLLNHRPSNVLYQNCQMDRDDQMAVDLLGNVMTCQNVGAKGKHRIGNVMLMDKVSLNTSWHWSKREECSSCPLLQLCKGACMYQEGDNFVSTCNSEFAYNMAFFVFAIKLLTGQEIELVEGNMIRPKYSYEK